MSLISEKIQQGLRWITHQPHTGGFFHRGEHAEMRSPFFTAMILLCLREVHEKYSEAEKLIQEGICFIDSQISSENTCNYISREESSPYPDDLDDTFLCLLCKKLFTKEPFHEQHLLKVLAILIRNEQSPGGPYYTWDIPPPQRETWNNIDVVVNSTIHYYLSQENIFLPQLQSYLDHSIHTKNFHSDFYHSPVIVIYFLTRNYTGNEHHLLRETLWSYYENNSWGTLTETITALIALLRLGESPQKIFPIIESYIEIDYDHLEHDPFFREQITQDAVSYASCVPLTVALHIELLACYEHAMNTPSCETSNTLSRPLSSQYHETLSLAQVSERCMSALKKYPLLKEQFRETLATMGSGELFENILLIPLLSFHDMSSVHKQMISSELLLEISAGALFGWMGYTLGDMILDRETTTDTLPLATSSMMLSLYIFEQASNPEHRHWIHECLLEIHEAWCHELQHGRTHLRREKIPLPLHNEYSSPTETAQSDILFSGKKSLGILAGLLVLVGHLTLSLEEKNFLKENLYNFFIRYLTLRQLGDDIHDWYEDLHQGHINPVGSAVLREYQKLFPQARSVHIRKSYHDLHAIFWHSVFPMMTQRIELLIHEAEEILRDINFLSRDNFLAHLLEKESKTLIRAQTERDTSLRFIEVYREMFGK